MSALAPSVSTTHRKKLGLLALWVVACGLAFPTTAPAAPPDVSTAKPLVQDGDRVAWVGSSSTRIGVWPRTVEFLMRTRHPGLDLRFERFTTGGGTFATGLEHIDRWLEEFRPTIVVLNYGGNDADAGREGLPKFKDDMGRCVAKARDKGARVVLVTPQAADNRKSGVAAAAIRSLYAETMLAHGREQGWTVIDVHNPLDAMQKANQRDDPAYTILKDHIHLTDPAYIAWGFFFYDRLDLPLVESEAVLTAKGQVTSTENCEIRHVKVIEGGLSFNRLDKTLPILPPGPLPPRLSGPMEALSRYLLAVTGLAPGMYEIVCDGQVIGAVDAEALALGVNLNSVLLDEGRKAPWAALAKAIWEGQDLDRIGRTRWRFEVRKR